MCGQLTPLTKDFHRLLKNINRLSNNQAKVVDYEDNISEFTLEIKPSDGLYRRGKFEFKIELENYPQNSPTVKCLTYIYHPNIEADRCEDGSGYDVCLSLFDDWTAQNDLEDCVQGLLFLLYQPNLGDPLNPHFDPKDEDLVERFAENVRISLEGGEVEDTIYFERNIVEEENTDEIGKENSEMQTTAIERVTTTETDEIATRTEMQEATATVTIDAETQPTATRTAAAQTTAMQSTETIKAAETKIEERMTLDATPTISTRTTAAQTTTTITTQTVTTQTTTMQTTTQPTTMQIIATQDSQTTAIQKKTQAQIPTETTTTRITPPTTTRTVTTQRTTMQKIATQDSLQATAIQRETQAQIPTETTTTQITAQTTTTTRTVTTQPSTIQIIATQDSQTHAQIPTVTTSTQITAQTTIPGNNEEKKKVTNNNGIEKIVQDINSNEENIECRTRTNTCKDGIVGPTKTRPNEGNVQGLNKCL